MIEASGTEGALGRLRAHALGLAGFLWAALYLLATRTQPLRLNWGDPYTDSHIQSHGRIFAEHGFIATRFIAVADVGPLTEHSLRYTHYPPLPDVLNGVQQRLFGPQDIATYRILADVFTLASLYFFYRWLRALFGAATAGVSLLLLTTSVIWLEYADTIHHIPVYWFFGSLAVFWAEKWCRRPSRALLALVFGATFVCDFASYDWFFFVPVLVGGTVWLTGGRLRDRKNWPLLAAVVLGGTLSLVAKQALVAWAVGPGEMLRDFVFQLEERATSKHSTDYRAGFWPILYHRTLRFFTPFLFVVLPLQLAALFAWLRKRELAAGLPSPKPLLLLLAGLPFLVLFSQLFVEQHHPTLQLVHFYAVGLGGTIAYLWSRGDRVSRAAGALTLLVALGWQARELVTFEKTFYPRDAAQAISSYLRDNDRHIVIYTNSPVDAPFRNYFQRHGLVLAGTDASAVPGILAQFFDEHGEDEPVHFIQFPDVEKTAFDKGLYAVYAAKKRWDIIADPAGHRAEWVPFLLERDLQLVSAFERVGTKVLDVSGYRMYRLTRASLDAELTRRIGDEDTLFVDFGQPSSSMHKLRGIRYTESFPDKPGFSWTVDRRPARYRFTLKGLLTDKYGPPRNEAIVLVRARRASRIVVRALAGAADQTVAVALNGRLLGEGAFGADWTELAFDVPSDALAEDGLQRISLTPSKVNEHGLGIALQWLRVEP